MSVKRPKQPSQPSQPSKAAPYIISRYYVGSTLPTQQTLSTQQQITLKPLLNERNSCFIHTAIQAICWAAYEGPLEFILTDWDRIKNHPLLNDQQTFVYVFEALLINHQLPTPTPYEIHYSFLSLNRKIKGLRDTTGNAKLYQELELATFEKELAEDPNEQTIDDAFPVLLWLIRMFEFIVYGNTGEELSYANAPSSFKFERKSVYYCTKCNTATIKSSYTCSWIDPNMDVACTNTHTTGESKRCDTCGLDTPHIKTEWIEPLESTTAIIFNFSIRQPPNCFTGESQPYIWIPPILGEFGHYDPLEKAWCPYQPVREDEFGIALLGNFEPVGRTFHWYLHAFEPYTVMNRSEDSQRKSSRSLAMGWHELNDMKLGTQNTNPAIQNNNKVSFAIYFRRPKSIVAFLKTVYNDKIFTTPQYFLELPHIKENKAILARRAKTLAKVRDAYQKRQASQTGGETSASAAGSAAGPSASRSAASESASAAGASASGSASAAGASAAGPQSLVPTRETAQTVTQRIAKTIADLCGDDFDVTDINMTSNDRNVKLVQAFSKSSEQTTGDLLFVTLFPNLL